MHQSGAAYTECMRSADTKVGRIETVDRDPVAQAKRDGAGRGFATNSFGTPARQPSPDYNNAQYNQRMQDRVDRQDSRAMQQMQNDARFRNRVNEYNVRR